MAEEEKDKDEEQKSKDEKVDGGEIGDVHADIPPRLPQAEVQVQDGVSFDSPEPGPGETDSEADSDLDGATIPVVTNTPRPSITAAIRRGSYYGDISTRVSLLDALSPLDEEEVEAEAGGEGDDTSDWSSLTEAPDPDSGQAADDEAKSEASEELDEELLSTRFRVYAMGFLEGLLERLSLMAILPGASSIQDTSVNLEEVPDGLPVLAEKTALLDSANLIHFSLGVPSKVSKFSIETAWLIDVLTATLKEVEESKSFKVLYDILEEDNYKVKRLPESIAHVKELKDKMNMLNVLIEAEAQTQKEAMREWAKNLVQRKQELKELRRQNMIQYRYEADTALATGDLCRRDYEVRLVNLRAENVRLKKDLEAEKKVHDASVEFLKKQNMDLREEAVALQAGYEVDAHNLDHMIEMMKLQKKEKELILAELEPRYLQEMAELEAARLEAIRKQEEFFANQGRIELSTFAALRIQRIWRGYLVRKVYRKVLRKLKKKRLAAKKKGKGGKGGKKKGKKKR